MSNSAVCCCRYVEAVVANLLDVQGFLSRMFFSSGFRLPHRPVPTAPVLIPSPTVPFTQETWKFGKATLLTEEDARYF